MSEQDHQGLSRPSPIRSPEERNLLQFSPFVGIETTVTSPRSGFCRVNTTESNVPKNFVSVPSNELSNLSSTDGSNPKNGPEETGGQNPQSETGKKKKTLLPAALSPSNKEIGAKTKRLFNLRLGLKRRSAELPGDEENASGAGLKTLASPRGQMKKATSLTNRSLSDGIGNKSPTRSRNSPSKVGPYNLLNTTTPTREQRQLGSPNSSVKQSSPKMSSEVCLQQSSTSDAPQSDSSPGPRKLRGWKGKATTSMPDQWRISQGEISSDQESASNAKSGRSVPRKENMSVNESGGKKRRGLLERIGQTVSKEISGPKRKNSQCGTVERAKSDGSLDGALPVRKGSRLRSGRKASSSMGIRLLQRPPAGLVAPTGMKSASTTNIEYSGKEERTNRDEGREANGSESEGTSKFEVGKNITFDGYVGSDPDGSRSGVSDAEFQRRADSIERFLEQLAEL